MAKTVVVDGVTYVEAQKFSDYAMVRTRSAGAFAGHILKTDGQHYTLSDSRRIWYWDGAASLSQLATEGTAKPDKCKFPQAVDCVELYEVIEVIPMTEKAKKSIDAVKVWKQ